MENLNNQVQLIGRIGQDLEVNETKNGKKVLNFSVATDAGADKNNEGERITDWNSCVAWEKTGELIAEHCAKGDLVLVKGQLKTRTSEKDGQKYYNTEVLVHSFQRIIKKS